MQPDATRRWTSSAEPDSPSVKQRPVTTVAIIAAMPVATNLPGNGKGRADWSVAMRLQPSEPKPQARSKPPLGKTPGHTVNRPLKPRKPTISRDSPQRMKRSAGRASFGARNGVATRTGTNCSSAPENEPTNRKGVDDDQSFGGFDRKVRVTETTGQQSFADQQEDKRRCEVGSIVKA